LQLYNDFAYTIIIDNSIGIENSTPACRHPQIESQQVQRRSLNIIFYTAIFSVVIVRGARIQLVFELT
jgi:hypothetical protein